MGLIPFGNQTMGPNLAKRAYLYPRRTSTLTPFPHETNPSPLFRGACTYPFYIPLGQMNPKGLLMFIPLSPKGAHIPHKEGWKPRKPRGYDQGVCTSTHRHLDGLGPRSMASFALVTSDIQPSLWWHRCPFWIIHGPQMIEPPGKPGLSIFYANQPKRTPMFGDLQPGQRWPFSDSSQTI